MAADEGGVCTDAGRAMRSSPLGRSAHRFGRRHSQPPIDFPCNAPQRDGKLSQNARPPGEYRIKALPKTRRDLAEPVERALAQVRAVVEHPFHIVKNRFHHKKLRYRGLKKNTAQLHTLFALANLVIVKQALLAEPGK